MNGRDVTGEATVLVTGAAGFIGSALCALLQSQGRPVVAFDNLSRGRPDLLPPGVRLVEGDIRDAARTKAVVADARPAWVVHLAAMHFIPDCIARPRETMDVNVEGTRHVLEACRDSGVQSVLLASSAAVYAPVETPCTEDATPLRPLEVYGESKLAAEGLARAFHDETGVPVAILRLFNAIGPNETNPHVIPHIFESLRTSDVVRLGNISPRRDYVDTRDIARAIVAAAARVHGCEVFNVGTGVASSVQDVLDSLSGILGRRIAIEQEPARVRAIERMLLVADIGKIGRETGWTPGIALEGTLRELARAYGLVSAPHESR